MVFSSPTFLFLFLPVTLLLYLVAPARARNAWLLVASALFYLWGAGDQIGVILLVSLVSFLGGLALRRRDDDAPPRRGLLALVVVLLLTPLLVVKYLPPLADGGRALGLDRLPALDIALPLGVSFFTFHAISYVVDVARRDLPAERSLRDYLLYLFLFPHQIAGPIVRYAEIRDELRSPQPVVTSQAAYGATRFAWGLAKKACIADPCGLVADSVFAQADGDLSSPAAWLGASAYALQIYFDFSGYSDMAIGLAMLFGFHFPENFDGPYRSVGFTDFWRRWHMTLSRWFRDYVYIPFGGNRYGVRREYAGLLLTFLLTSLWHGATPPFLLWGALHSLALVVERLTGLRRVRRLVLLRRAVFAVLLVLSWVPFRAPDLDVTGAMWGAMLAGGWGPLPPEVLVALTPLTTAALLVGAAAFLGPRGSTWFRTTFSAPSALEGLPRRGLALASVACPALLAAAVVAVLWTDFSPFLYFQF